MMVGSKKCVWLGTLVLLVASALPGCGSDGSSSKKSFGSDCISDSECDSSLVCATLGSTSVTQCTSRCSSSDECRTRFGVAFCIGAGYCVRDCSDRSCGGGQYCNANDWCE